MTKIITFLLLLCTLTATAQKGKLNKAKETVNTKNTATASKSKKANVNGNDMSAEDVVFILRLFGIGLYGIFGKGDYSDLNIYPYYQGVNGEYLVESYKEDIDTGEKVMYHYKKSSLTIGGNYFAGSSVNGFQAQVSFRPVFMLGIDASYKKFYEDIIDERVSLSMFNIMGNLYRVRTKYVTGWWGLGYTRVGSDIDAGGFAYQLGIDFFPMDPVSFRTLWKQSFINKQQVNTFQLQGKYHYKRTAFFAGWDFNRIAKVNIGGFSLGIEYILH